MPGLRRRPAGVAYEAGILSTPKGRMMSATRMPEQRPSLDELAICLLRSGGPMTVDELEAEIGVMVRNRLVDVDRLDDGAVEATLGRLASARRVMESEPGSWVWVPPRVVFESEAPRQARLFE